ncbi:putative 2-octaprenyl-3-methyl-6-methoxy-1, 4-benzoquinol hydroxylase [Candidatus Nitrospira nitrosa]|uniref:Putative 2-octaprenyl-3-methyl-6-methoxy-1, 4-benzoquinol hydroxylase n=1 Tax=Candidatus Nitrospira nitrosa TaxID=1742972 RepID=A0A0S4LPT1_9BACT|nr:FAD-dependent monooxygenase [Candidatus Nitrospira nitrosa]CUS38698.1 putative 2-octaprenyl-3-methyl-6-methoxy-1, 4-benzoquinol hydroxylase [Candidatus Nitrospira nitrosa]
MVEETDIAVVGAGGGGAVLALALAQKGIKTIVLEQAPGPPLGLRGEILQPNGQQVLDRLGLLNKLPVSSTRTVHQFHFCRVGGQRLCTIDYRDLPPPYNQAVVTLPNVAHHAIVDAVEREPSVSLRYRATFTGLLRENGRVVGLTAKQGDQERTIKAKVVVGADGAFSKVREALQIPADLYLYPQGYLIALLDAAIPMDEAKYFVGKRTILGLFPAAGDKVYAFYMIKTGSYDQVKAQGLSSLQNAWIAIDPSSEPIFRTLIDWKQTAFLPTGRVRTPTWVADGAVLVGDAAHAMNPHASQGRMQAMVDAMTLADLLPECLATDDYSAATLKRYEESRRPHVAMLQKLADEQVLFWNTANPLIGFLRDRVFSTLDRNARLRYRVLSTTAGLRKDPPFGMLDRLMAAGFLPDPSGRDMAVGGVR